MTRFFLVAVMSVMGVVTASAADSISLAGVTIQVPDDFIGESVSSERGVDSVTLQMGTGRVDVTSYGWSSLIRSPGPKTAQEYISSIRRDDEIEPMKEFEFQGHKAWAHVRKETVGMPSRGIPNTTWVEKTVFIQRPFGFVVFSMSTLPSFFESDRARFDSFLSNIRFSRQPPVGPQAAASAAAALLAALGALFYRKYRSKYKLSKEPSFP